jgi:signal transduction histidine kinase
LLPGMKDYWRDLGARAFVDTLPELIMQVQTLAKNQLRTRDRRWQIAQKIEAALFAPEPDVIASQSSADGTTTVAVDRRAKRSRPLVSIGDVLQEALPRLARVINDEIELVLESELDAPRVRCAAIDIERIALHLVQDAANAIPLGGKIWLFVERQGQRDVRIEVLDSSGNSRIAGPNVDSARLIVDRYFGALRIVDLGGATSLQAVLPAVVDPAN